VTTVSGETFGISEEGGAIPRLRAASGVARSRLIAIKDHP
jgi:hypothetical protein